ncbi:MAG: hypothetical protein ACOX9R_09920 [Armatimonadota bacterium]|jgi:hypothetical protein
MRGLPRFGGFNPLKLLAIVGGVVVGGAVAVAMVSLLVVVLTLIGVATAGLSWLLTYGWIIAAWLIYRAIRSRQAPKEYATGYVHDLGAQGDEERRREAEYRRRVEELSRHATAPRPDIRPKRETGREAGTVILAVLAGLALASGANVALGGLNLSPMAGRFLPMLTGAGVGVGVYAALKRWVMPPLDDEQPPAKQVRGQIARIRRKSRELSREAERAGGVFSGLDTQAERLASEASELADRLFDLRRVAGDARKALGNPTRPAHASTASDAPQRLDELLARNRAAQHQCLAQIERIEDLLDVARLEIACPDQGAPADAAREELVREVETELEAARRALAEVQRQSQTI